MIQKDTNYSSAARSFKGEKKIMQSLGLGNHFEDFSNKLGGIAEIVMLSAK